MKKVANINFIDFITFNIIYSITYCSLNCERDKTDWNFCWSNFMDSVVWTANYWCCWNWWCSRLKPVGVVLNCNENVHARKGAKKPCFTSSSPLWSISDVRRLRWRPNAFKLNRLMRFCFRLMYSELSGAVKATDCIACKAKHAPWHPEALRKIWEVPHALSTKYSNVPRKIARH